MSTTTTKFGLIKPTLNDTADITAFNSNWDKIDEALSNTNQPVTATSSDGVYYTATVPNLTNLYVGLKLTIIPNKTSAAKTPQININGLGYHEIWIKAVTPTNYIAQPHKTDWLGDDMPVDITYDGIHWCADVFAVSGDDITTPIPVSKGGNAVVYTSGTATEYTATLDGVTSLTNGLSFTLIPHISNEVGATLNINSLGARPFKHMTTYMRSSTNAVDIEGYYLFKETPVRVTYNFAGQFWAVETDVMDISSKLVTGRLPIDKGGTGASNAEDARNNLQVAPALESTYWPGCYSRSVNGVTEWINPPMNSGSEFRTTERFDEKNVFRLFKKISVRVANTTPIVHNNLATGIDMMLSYSVRHLENGILVDSNGINDFQISVSVEDGNLKVVFDPDRALSESRTFYCEFRYTKAE